MRPGRKGTPIIPHVQHSSHIEPGRDGLFNLVRSTPPTLKYEPGVFVAEGDFIIVHGRYSGIGLPVNWIVADIVRMQDGVLVEHWDLAQGLYLFSVGFTARRATSAEVSKASRLTLFLQANRSDLRAEVSKASRLTLFLQANRPDLPAEVSMASYLYSEVFDLKPTSGLYLRNSAHLSNFLTPRTVSAIGRRCRIFCRVLFFRWFPAKTCAKKRECLLPN